MWKQQGGATVQSAALQKLPTHVPLAPSHPPLLPPTVGALALHAKVGAAVGDQCATLQEGARVKQRGQTLTRGQLALE